MSNVKSIKLIVK